MSGCFPTKWKLARVTPLFKDGAQDCRDNYRPISLLSILSKVCEKHVATSFMDYLVKTGLLYELQSVFRAGHSTESALISVTDHILFNLDEEKLSGMVFVDFRKAFDVVVHQLLLTKLCLYRVSDPSLSWFESYLSGRQQFVSIDGQRSLSTYQAGGTTRKCLRSNTVFVICEWHSITSNRFKCGYLRWRHYNNRKCAFLGSMLDDPTFKFQSWCGSELGVLQQNVHQLEKKRSPF